MSYDFTFNTTIRINDIKSEEMIDNQSLISKKTKDALYKSIMEIAKKIKSGEIQPEKIDFKQETNTYYNENKFPSRVEEAGLKVTFSLGSKGRDFYA